MQSPGYCQMWTLYSSLSKKMPSSPASRHAIARLTQRFVSVVQLSKGSTMPELPVKSGVRSTIARPETVLIILEFNHDSIEGERVDVSAIRDYVRDASGITKGLPVQDLFLRGWDDGSGSSRH